MAINHDFKNPIENQLCTWPLITYSSFKEDFHVKVVKNMLLIENCKTIVSLLLMIQYLASAASANGSGFTFNGNLQLGGVAEVRPDGLFRLTNVTSFSIGHAFYSQSWSFKNSSNPSSSAAAANSFSTTFAFAIVPEKNMLNGHGMAFVIAPTKELPGASSSQHLGLFNFTNNGKPSNHIVAVELDTFRNQEFDDIDDNHVGIDINGLNSVKAAPAAYFSDKNGEVLKNLSLTSGERMLAWVEYDALNTLLNVTISPIHISKPKLPLLSLKIDLSPIVLDEMYVGFSSATGRLVANHYVLGWSFQLNGKAEELDISKLPSLPAERQKSKKMKQIALHVGLSLNGAAWFTIITVCIYRFWLSKKKREKFTELFEDWEVQYGPHRFSYKDLEMATKGFSGKELLGQGGFGQVYKGVLPVSEIQVAVKRISHESKQGMREFVAEIATIGRLRHPNLVRLLGYCRGKGELLLVYDYMPNASLDKFLYNNRNLSSASTLGWNQRFKIIKDVASALLYLHEKWLEVIIHRDIKASNVLLDGELNGKLGDFGLAKCFGNTQDPQTTRVAGTLGYIAPELARTGKASTSSDVFGFGVFCLEVACGRRPLEPGGASEILLVDWVLQCWKEDEILRVADQKLDKVYNVVEMELVLKLGLLCSHNLAAYRPSMSQVVRHLSGQDPLPANFDAYFQADQVGETNSLVILNQSANTCKKDSVASLTNTDSFLSVGR